MGRCNFVDKHKPTLAVSTSLLVFIKTVPLRVQTAPFDKVTIDFWRSRKRLHIPDLLKAKKSSVRSTFFRRWCFHQKCYVSGPDGSVWQNNDWFLQISEASTQFRPPRDQKSTKSDQHIYQKSEIYCLLGFLADPIGVDPISRPLKFRSFQ